MEFQQFRTLVNCSGAEPQWYPMTDPRLSACPSHSHTLTYMGCCPAPHCRHRGAVSRPKRNPGAHTMSALGAPATGLPKQHAGIRLLTCHGASRRIHA